MGLIQTSRSLVVTPLIHASASLLFKSSPQVKADLFLDLFTVILSNCIIHSHPPIQKYFYKRIDTKKGEQMMMLTLCSVFTITFIYKIYQIGSYYLVHTNQHLLIKVTKIVCRVFLESIFFFAYFLQAHDIYRNKVKEKQQEIAALFYKVTNAIPSAATQKNSQTSGLFALPEEIFPHLIFTYLSGEEIAKVASLSRGYHQLVSSSRFHFYRSKVRCLEIALLQVPYISFQDANYLALLKFSRKYTPQKIGKMHQEGEAKTKRKAMQRIATLLPS